MAVTRVGLLVWCVVALTVMSGCGGGGGGGQAERAPTDEVSSTTVPATTTTRPPRPDVPAVIAHRGASADAPEHTFAAYDLAVDQGADYLEQDVQLTADGELVVLHDPVLDRTARGPRASCTGPVGDKTLAQLRDCEVGSWFNEANPDRADPAFVGLSIPTMAEVLERYGPGVRYYIELKDPAASPGVAEELLELLDEAGLTDDVATTRQVLIQSFSAESLRQVHARRPELPLVQLIGAGDVAIDDARLADVQTYAVAIGPAFVNVDEPLVEAAHARCLDVHPYTVDDPATMDALLGIGADGMFTNRPALLVERREGHPAPDHCRRRTPS